MYLFRYKKKKNNKKEYFYQLDVDRYSNLVEIVDRRQKFKDIEQQEGQYQEVSKRYGFGWSFVDELYRFKYSDDEVKWMCPGVTYNLDGEEIIMNRDIFGGSDDWGDIHKLRDDVSDTKDDFVKQWIEGDN